MQLIAESPLMTSTHHIFAILHLLCFRRTDGLSDEIVLVLSYVKAQHTVKVEETLRGFDVYGAQF